MAKILLANFAEAPIARLTELFRKRGHYVLVLGDGQSISEALGATDDTDLIILDVSNDDVGVRQRLAEVSRCRKRRGIRPMLLCVSTVYRGARFELDIEHQGARLVYV